jgi:hypothetical protein
VTGWKQTREESEHLRNCRAEVRKGNAEKWFHALPGPEADYSRKNSTLADDLRDNC